MGLEVQVLSWAQKSKDGKSAGEAGAFTLLAMHGIKNQQLRFVFLKCRDIYSDSHMAAMV
jgi:hypothetical protein